MLLVNNLSVSYDGIKALTKVSLEIREGEIVSLMGSNGAGKSTLLQSIMGLVPKLEGTVKLRDQDISVSKTSEIVKKGISMVSESRDIFPSLSVKENLRLGLFVHDDRSERQASFEGVYALFPRLKVKEKQLAGTLSGGEQQMLAIGRALMQKPKYLLLDEPSLGLSPKLTDELFEKIMVINKEGTSVLLVEQKAKLAMKVASRGYLLTTGTVARQGTSEELSQDELVKKTYFGD